MKLYSVLLCLLLALPTFAQRKSKIKKNSNAKGTIFGYWGYNRSAYTKSDLTFIGEGYNFTLRNATAHDNPSDISLKAYLDFAHITVPQFNARVGYYFKNRYAISFGYDHMKYIFDDKNHVLLDGTIDPSLNTSWVGTHVNEPVVTDRDTFHYENSNGLNYLRVELMRSDMLFRTKNKKFAITWNNSIGAGSILSFNDFTFAGQKDMVTISMSGYGLSAHSSLRFEFFNHFFLQTEGSAGFLHQLKVKNRHHEPAAYTKQKFGYVQGNVVLGFFLYLRTTNSCDSCPNW